MNLTEKQRELLELWRRGELRRINVLEGAVSSGKTWGSLLLWVLWVGSMPRAGSYLMCAKSLNTLERNCLKPLSEIAGDGFRYSLSKKEGALLGRKILLEGACDSRAESKIRGLTLQGAYCDELTQIPEEFFAMLLSRLRRPGAKLIATTNPDAPSHWLMRRYLSRAEELDLLDLHFTLSDNPLLPEEYVENLKREYTGAFYDRFVLGKWVRPEGLIYPMFGPDCLGEPEGPCGRWVISVDYGIRNPTAMLLWGYWKGVWYQVDEFYHSGREAGETLTDQDYYEALERLAGDRQVEKVIVDPSAASFLSLIRRERRFKAVKAVNGVLEGISATAGALRTGKIKVGPDCAATIREYGLYMWDPAGGEKPRKEQDHAMDATRYFVSTMGLMRRRRDYSPLWNGPA